MTEKQAFWTKETTITLSILVLFSALVAYLIWDENTSSNQTPYVSAANSREAIEYVEEPTQDVDSFDSEYVSVGASSAPKSAHSNPSMAATTEFSQSVTVEWVIAELRRLIRAGRSMEALRNSDNLTLNRRCLDGMQKLQKQSRSIMSRGGSLPFPTEPPTINEVISKIKVCTSCGSSARKACIEAERDITLIAKGVMD